jgi:predicted ferric reductase
VAISDEDREKRQLAHYAASVTAWFNTRMEHDKSLLTLSTAAIGVLVTLAPKLTLTCSASLVVYAAALLSFISCLVIVLWIFKRNCQHLEKMVHNEEANDPILNILDYV